MITLLGMLFVAISISVKFMKSNPINKMYLPYFKGLFVTGIAIILLAPLHMIFQLIPIMFYALWSLYLLDTLIANNER